MVELKSEKDSLCDWGVILLHLNRPSPKNDKHQNKIYILIVTTFKPHVDSPDKDDSYDSSSSTQRLNKFRADILDEIKTTITRKTFNIK